MRRSRPHRHIIVAMAPRTLRDDGAALVEYSLLVTFIAMVCVLAVAAFGTAVAGLFSVTL